MSEINNLKVLKTATLGTLMSLATMFTPTTNQTKMAEFSQQNPINSAISIQPAEAKRRKACRKTERRTRPTKDGRGRCEYIVCTDTGEVLKELGCTVPGGGL